MRPKNLALLVAGVCLGAAFAPISAAVAKGRAPDAVRQPADLCTKAAKSGKARITELARGKNAFVGILEMNPGGKVPQHRDQTEEYIHILSGTGTIHIDGAAHEVGPGSTVYMPANAQVSFEGGPTTLSAIQVFAGPQPADKYDAWIGCP